MKKGRSWKTTSFGIAAIAGALVRLAFAIISHNFTEEAVTTCISGTLTGIGLLFAKDGNVTGGSVVSIKDKTQVDTIKEIVLPEKAL